MADIEKELKIYIEKYLIESINNLRHELEKKDGIIYVQKEQLKECEIELRKRDKRIKELEQIIIDNCDGIEHLTENGIDLYNKIINNI